MVLHELVGRECHQLRVTTKEDPTQVLVGVVVPVHARDQVIVVPLFGHASEDVFHVQRRSTSILSDHYKIGPHRRDPGTPGARIVAMQGVSTIFETPGAVSQT